ncbi:MAG: GAF domain-containing protein [Elusimicrobia bacterium]|nr:GAF domain-containing protein [Elusimicrobiota bacterium]
MEKEKVEDLELLLEVGRLLSSKLELEELLYTVMELATKLVGAETSSLLLLDEEKRELYFDVALGRAGRQVKPVRLKLGEGIAGWVAQKGMPLLVPDISRDPRWSPQADAKTGFQTRSILAVPMILKGKVIGVLEAINRLEGEFQKEDLRSLESFASQAAVCIENARLFSFLREEKEKLALLFQEMQEGVLVTGPEWRVEFVNPAAQQLLGISAQGQDLKTLLASFHLAPPLEGWGKMSGRQLGFECVREKPKGFVLAGRAGRLPPRPPREVSQGWILVFRDVTEERRQERLKQDFLSLISHKLKTPLVSILGYTPLLLEGESQLNAFQRKAVGAVHRQGIKLSRLVEKLLDFVLMESPSGLTLNPSLFRCQELVEGALKSLRGDWQDLQVAIEVLPEVQSLQVFGDRTLLGEMVEQLLENAVKFNPKEKKRVWIGGRQVPGGLELFVRDDGSGVPSEEHSKIFEKFYQSEEYFTGQVEGWGLGLTLAQKIAEEHGGRVTLQSQMGQGSTFSVFLPYEQSAP